jgi:hypothetical protein
MHLLSNVLLRGTLDCTGGSDLSLDGSRKEGGEQFPLLLPREQCMVAASFPHRLHRLDTEPMVGRDQRMHRRCGHPALCGDLFGFPGRTLRRVDDEPPLAVQGARRCLQTLLDFFGRQVGGCTCDPWHSPSASESDPSCILAQTANWYEALGLGNAIFITLREAFAECA